MNSDRNKIKNGPILPVYLFYGSERYFLLQYKNLLLNRLGVREGDMNFTKYTKETFEINECLDTARTLPFFADRRVVLVQDADLFSKKNDALREYLNSPPDSTCIIFIEESVRANLGTTKAIQKQGGAFEFSAPSQRQLETWILKRISASEKKIRRDAFGEFWLRAGTDMTHIFCELEKLLAYCGGKEDIELADVRAICSGAAEITVFDMTDAISEKNPVRAFALCEELFEEKQTPVGILMLISRAFQQLLAMKEYTAERMSDQEIAGQMHIPSFIIRKKLRPMAANFTESELKHLLKEAADLDEQIKRGRIDGRLAVTRLIRIGTHTAI